MAAKKTPAKKTTAKSTKVSRTATPHPKRREVGAVICGLLAILSLLGYFTKDGWFVLWFNAFLHGLIGYGAYAAIPVLLLATWILTSHRGRPVRVRLTCAFSIAAFLGALSHLFSKCELVPEENILTQLWENAEGKPNGGVIGGLLTMMFKSLFGYYGAAAFFLVLLAICFFGATDVTPAQIGRWVKNRKPIPYEQQPEPEPEDEMEKIIPNQYRRSDYSASGNTSRTRKNGAQVLIEDGNQIAPTPLKKKTEEEISAIDDYEMPPFSPDIDPFEEFQLTGFSEASEPVSSRQIHNDLPPLYEARPVRLSEKDIADAGFEVAEAIQQNLDNQQDGEYVYPPTRLLTAPAVNTFDWREEVALYTKRLDTALRSFKIDAEIVNTVHGPSITRYDVELEQGVKLSTLTNRADDIALALGASGVRVAPVPDMASTVGIEVPNKTVATVHLREIIESREFQTAKSKITFAIGKDIANNPIVGNISTFPHLLIAGTTGSGKSVCMNSLILSLLFKSSPEDVRLIMIDPKMVELGVYNGIPHLLTPVITDPKKAAGALQFGVYEMQKRYKLFSEIGTRDLEAYNAIMVAEGSEKLPQIVVLIDELADLMMTAPKDVEESIVRIAQLGRASGLHLVVATQRPSADIITSTMKANIPSRIAFTVASAINSRIIIDQMGAEKLIGKGDMLFAPVGIGKPIRVQGCFVSDREREDIIEFIKANAESNYSEEILTDIENRSSRSSGSIASADSIDSVSSQIDMFTNAIGKEPAEPVDEMFSAAVEVMLETGQASVSMLQRRLKLGYGRASRIVDQMEERGIVGQFDGSKPRQLLINRDEWNEMKDSIH